ncbi:MAG TPA: IS1634 family transposase [Chthoniobacterales bacterium]
MFVQATKSKRGNITYVSYLVREAFRTPAGPRSRTVCNITALPPEARDALAAALAGTPCVPLEGLSLSSALNYGGLAVLRDAWARFGLNHVLAALPDPRQRALLQAMIFGRILSPCSKRALADAAHGTLLAAACGLDQATEAFDEDDLYDAMDALNGRWVPLEQALYGAAFPAAVSLVLYDLTSVYFEGKGPAGFSEYGYRRDHWPDRPQVLLAVATDAHGVPIHVEVLRGNRADTETLRGLLHTLRRRLGIREAVFVFDGGMSSRLNLEALRAEELPFVTRLSAASLPAVLAALPQDAQPLLWDRTSLVEVTLEGKRYVIAGGEERRHRDRARRQARLQKAEAELTRLAAVRRNKVDPQQLASQAGRALQRLQAHQYFDYRVDEQGRLCWQPKQALLDAEQSRDGLYLLHTGLTPAQGSPGQVLGHYKNLMAVEEAFCHLKTYLEVRPVCHFRPDRVRNHVRLCFLAYWLCARLGQEWRAKGQTVDVPRLLRRLQAIRVGTVTLAGKAVRRLLTQIPAELNAVLEPLGLLALFAQPPRWAQP